MKSHKSGFKEQRSFPRIPADESSAVMLSSANVISYSVLNISKAGLAFCYDGSTDTSSIDPISTLTLFSNYFGAKELPVEVISDSELTGDEIPESMGRGYLRKCSVKFLSMSEDQEKVVDEYLRGCYFNKEM